MSTEELPADLGRLKISPIIPHIKLMDRDIPIALNPFYNAEISSAIPSADADGKLTQGSNNRLISSRRCRIRRRSESFLDEYRQVDTSTEPVTYELLNPLRSSPGVQKLPLRKTYTSTTRDNLLREPILHTPHNCVPMKCSLRGRRPILFNCEDKKVHTPAIKLRTSFLTKPNGICSFRDLISECNSLLEYSGVKQSRLRSTWHSSKSFTTLQAEGAGTITTDAIKVEHRNPLNEPRVASSSMVRLHSNTTCSQQASSSAANSSNCDDVTIDELASYFDTMVHIPKKMSSMAEMMYI